MKEILMTPKQRTAAKHNAKLLWDFITKDRIGSKKFASADMPDNYINKVTRAAIAAGVPDDIVKSCIYYPEDTGPYPHNFKEFFDYRVETVVAAALNYSGVSSKKTTSFFFSKDITPALDDLRRRLDVMPDMEELSKFAEAPPKAPLGQIAFSPDRIDKVPKTEKNVDVEDELYDALVAHVHDNIPLTEEEIAIIKSIMKKGYYSKIFKAPDVEKVYRGMTINEKWLRKILKLSPKAKLPAKGSADVSFYYRPRKGAAMSWTRSKRKASSFTGQDGSYDIIFTAITEENVNNFLDLSGLYKVNPLDTYAKEKEVLGLVRVKVSRIEWSRKS